MPVWDVAGILAYALVFAALESGATLLVLLILSAILPGRMLRDRFAVYGSAVAFVALGCAAVDSALIYAPSVRLARRYPKAYVVGVVAPLLVLAAFCVLLWFNERLANAVASVVERMMLLMNVYMIVTLIAIVIVVARNL
jgi:hypothetical protein